MSIVVFISASAFARSPSEALRSLMPVPQKVEAGASSFRLHPNLRIVVAAPEGNDRLYEYANRFQRRLDEQTGLFLPRTVEPAKADASPERGTIWIRAEEIGEVALGMDETYQLRVAGEGVALTAKTDIGAMRGLETLLQLLASDADGYVFAGAAIEDAPRFPWRGLMIDSARHFMPLELIKRNLDGMAAVKLNVMHWHLTEDQGFRIESKLYPRLHEMGSDGLYYTQEEAKEIIAYAADRGIRVYPEFDVPGHATAWLVGHPELASAPGPYEIERQWGIFDPALDPTNELVYELLDGFFTEMAGLFPDAFFHIGGDEVNGVQWKANAKIQQFMKDHHLEDLHALQGHFNQRILKTLTRNGKTMIGWDEILVPGMPTNVVIHSWRGRDSMEKAAKEGYRSILSNGYYIDLMQPAREHYLVDPLPADIDLTAAEKERVLGGEATMWSEHVTPETVDSRIWPRTAAIAERLWSAREVNDVSDMYRRLEIASIRLEALGLAHIKNRGMLMRRLVGGRDIEPLRVLADVVEPLKIYRRNADNRYRSYSPYTLLPDIATADARDAMAFNALVDEYLNSGDATSLGELRRMLINWRDNDARFAELAVRAPALREALELSSALKALAELGIEALESKEISDAKRILENARKPVARVELQVVDAVERLLKQ